MAMPYLARLTHPEVSHSTFLSRRKLLDQEREFSNQNVWLPGHNSNDDLQVGPFPESSSASAGCACGLPHFIAPWWPTAGLHSRRQPTWMDPPSISDLRLWVALLTEGA